MAQAQQQHCPHCGAGINPRWEPLNAGLVSCLVEAIQAVHAKGENKFHLQKDLNLTHAQFTNFQKLRFHGLIAHADEDNPKSGEWLITRRGGQFLRGEIAIPKKRLVFRNKVLEDSTDRVHILQLKDKLPAFDRAEAYEYERPAEVNKPIPLFT